MHGHSENAYKPSHNKTEKNMTHLVKHPTKIMNCLPNPFNEDCLGL